MLHAVEGGVSFSVEDESGDLREAYADDLTVGQLRFMFFAAQEREKMKQEKSTNQSQLNQF